MTRLATHAAIAAVALAASLNVAAHALAQDATPERPAITFRTAAVASPVAGLTERLTIVCEPGRFVLSPDAMAACANGEFPQLVASGDRFRSSGIGAEFNTLLRQVRAPE